jgi:hypothetical protein
MASLLSGGAMIDTPAIGVQFAFRRQRHVAKREAERQAEEQRVLEAARRREAQRAQRARARESMLAILNGGELLGRRRELEMLKLGVSPSVSPKLREHYRQLAELGWKGGAK